MNSENGKTYTHRLLLNLTDKMTYQKVKGVLPCQILIFTLHGKT